MDAPMLPYTRRPARDFWLFFVGETISNLGSSFTLFAMPLLVYRLTHSSLNLGLSTAVEMAPYLLFGLVIGAWVDRLSRKRLMIVVDVLQALTLISVPVMDLLGSLNVWWLYGVGFVSATLKICFESSQFAAVPSLVSRDDLVKANGRLQASFSGAQMLGPVLAGALLWLLPLPMLLLIDAASFLVSAGTLALIQRRFNPDEERTQQSVREALVEGLRYVLHQPVLRGISTLAPLANLVSITATTQLVLFAVVQYHANQSQVSLFYAATSAGFLVFSLLASPLRKRWSFSSVALGGLLLMGVFLIVLAFTPWYWVALVGWALSQGGEMLFNVAARAMRQAIVPNVLLGRVMSVAYVLGWSSIPLGALGGGLIIGWVGQTHIALIYAAIGGLIVLIALCFSRTALAHAERYLTRDTAPTCEGTEHVKTREEVIIG